MAIITKVQALPLYVPRYQKGIVTFRGTDGSGYVGNLAVGQTPFFVADGQRSTRVTDSDWKVKVSKGQDATNPYDNMSVRWELGDTRVYTVEKSTNGDMWVSDLRSSFNFDPWNFAFLGDDAALKDLAVKRLKSKADAHQSQINALVPLVELREFRGMIVALTFSATDLVHALIRIKRTKGKSAFQFAAHAILNWNFAIAPTLAEIGQAAEHIGDLLGGTGNKRFNERGNAKKQWNTTTRLRNTSAFGGDSDITVSCTHTLSYRYVAGFSTPLRAGNNYSAAVASGFEMGAIVPALWELTLFSWLVDYFGTVGDYLDDTFITDQKNSFYCAGTRKYSCDMTFNVGPSKGAFVKGSTVSGNPTVCHWSSVKRIPYSAVPKRALRFKTTDEIGKNAITKLLNLGSILVGGKALSKTF